MISVEKIEEIYKEYPSHLTQKVKAHYKDTYECIDEKFEGGNFSEKIYKHCYGKSEMYCDLESCENQVDFLSFSRGFRKYCSRKCKDKNRANKFSKECKQCEKIFETYPSDDKDYCSHECYVEYRTERGELEDQLERARKEFWNDNCDFENVEKDEILSKEKIKNILNGKDTHLFRKIKSHSPKTVYYLNSEYKGRNFSEKLCRHLNDKIKEECFYENCNKKCRFKTFKEGYSKYCSLDCVIEDNDYSEIWKSAQETLLEKYGVRHPSQREEFIKKRKEIKKEKYADKNYNNIEKMKKTQLKKYGGVGFASEELNQKAKNTCKKKYNDENYNNRKKAIETTKERYGQKISPNALKKLKKRLENGEVGFGSKKYIKSIREKYNKNDIINVSQVQKIKDKKKKTVMKKKYENLFESDKFVDNVKPLFSFEEYEGVKDYKMYKFKCKDCGEKFEDYLSDGNVPRCPECHDGWSAGRSEKEKKVYEYVESILPDEVEVRANDKTVLDGKELDVYVPEKNVAIEFDGLYWHSEKNGERNRYYHQKKTQMCEEKGIQLIHIFEDEWRDKRGIVKNRLKHILDCSDEKTIYARECSVNTISRDRKSDFLNKYHIQGAGSSSVKLGLFHGDFFNSDLKAVMTFGTPSIAQGHKGDKENFWEMKRFALSQRVVGAAGKLFKHFIRNYEVDKVITYADRRWSTKLSNVYEKIGFEYKGYSNPNYFYFHVEEEKPTLQHRYGFRKNVLDERLKDFDPDLTEWENMQLHGYDRIWDSGNLKYEWKSKSGN